MPPIVTAGGRITAKGHDKANDHVMFWELWMCLGPALRMDASQIRPDVALLEALDSISTRLRCSPRRWAALRSLGEHNSEIRLCPCCHWDLASSVSMTDVFLYCCPAGILNQRLEVLHI